MPSETQLPLARMATINKPSFWVFIAACLLLYIGNKMYSPDPPEGSPYAPNDLYIMLAAFTGLLLNLVILALKNPKINRIISMVTYGFEIASILLLLMLVLQK